MNKIVGLLSAGLMLIGMSALAQDNRPRVYTLGVSGSVCGACAGELAKSLKGVDGCKVVLAPTKGEGDFAMTMVVVELSGKATLGKVVTALEAAKTPHAEKVAPGVLGAVPLKLKANTTGEQFIEALRKAGLLDE